MGQPKHLGEPVHWIKSQIIHKQNCAYTVQSDIWHQRMAHPSKEVLSRLGRNVKGCDEVKISHLSPICKGCVQGKMHNKAFSESEKRANKPLELIHADLMELPVESYHRKKWCLVILDDYSSYANVALLRSKSETMQFMKVYVSMMENQFNMKVKKFRSDRGGEFKSHEFDAFLNEKGIMRQHSAPYIHQQNGRAERINQTLMEKAETMRMNSSCPRTWWEFAIDAAVHVYNQTPLQRTNWKTPYENLYKRKPDIKYFRTFGCLAWVFIPKEIRKDKLSPKAEPMTFIGYDKGSKAYRFI